MLPFRISSLWGLHSKTHGFALVNEQGVRLVFKDAKDIETAPDEDADSIEIAWDNLQNWEIARGYVTDELKLRLKRPVGDEPDGKNDLMIQLELLRGDRDKLDRFEQQLQDYQTGKRKDDVEDVLDDVRDLLDRM